VSEGVKMEAGTAADPKLIPAAAECPADCGDCGDVACGDKFVGDIVGDGTAAAASAAAAAVSASVAADMDSAPPSALAWKIPAAEFNGFIFSDASGKR
jgi:hypothetical protein